MRCLFSLTHTLILFSLFLSGCGLDSGNIPGGGSSAAAIQTGRLLISNSATASLSGGLHLYGAMGLENISRSATVEGDRITWELINGQWNFWGLGWKGQFPYEGENFCAFESRMLSGTSFILPFHLNKSACYKGFSHPDYFNIENNQFFPLSIVNCRIVTHVTGAASTCDGAYLGLGESYQLTLFDYPEVNFHNLNGNIANAKMISRCINRTPGSSRTDTPLKIPVGILNASFSFSPFVTAIRSYPQANCQNEAEAAEYIFPRGLINGTTVFKAGKVRLLPDVAAQRALLFLEHAQSEIRGTLHLNNGTGHHFGSVPVGTRTEVSLQVINSGNTAISGLSMNALTSPFASLGHNCPNPLEPFVACSFGVAFTPTSAAEVSALVTFNYSDPTGSKNTSMGISGAGTDVSTNNFQALVILPGQNYEPTGTTAAAAVSGSPATQMAGTAYSVKVKVVDAGFLASSLCPGMVSLLVFGDMHAVISPSNMIFDANCEAVFSILPYHADMTGSVLKITPILSDVTITANSSSIFYTMPGAATQTVVSLPGQIFHPGSPSYSTAFSGGPIGQNMGTGFFVSVMAVDNYFNIVPNFSGTATVTTTDTGDVEPAGQSLISGQASFYINFTAAGNFNIQVQSISPTDLATHNVSSAVTVTYPQQ